MIERRGETGAISLHRKNPAVNVGAAERGLSALAGAALIVAGLSLRSWRGLALGVGGAALLVRGATGRSPLYRQLGVTTGPRAAAGGFNLSRSITICASREEIVQALREPEHWLPAELEAIPLEPQRWRIAMHLSGARATETEIDALVEEDGTLGWRSTGGSFEHQGRIFFGEAPRGLGTELRLVASVRPPGGRAGLLAVRPLSGVAERAVGHALAHLKQRIEVGEVATAAPTPTGGLPPRRVPARVARAEVAA